MADPDYFGRYQTIVFERDADGILLMRLKSREGDGPADYSALHHSEWVSAFAAIAADRGNRVLIITGTGDAFSNRFAWDTPMTNAEQFDTTYFEGKHLLRNLLDIEVPVIGAVNGPATVHAELAVMSDITLAATTATFQDSVHVTAGGVPGDGVQVVWLELLGVNRGRYFLLTGQTLSATEALALGVVNEVVAPEDLLARAYELARPLARLDPVTARYTRVVLTQRYKRLIDEGLAFGLAHEAIGVIESARLRRERRAARDAAARDATKA
jgi:enoyl-CoA hydratase/carnithine racemase